MGKKVVVAMSGGVDSSVAAALLQEQGYEVIGMMMRLWSEPGRDSQNRCCTPESMGVARQVAGILDIPFYAIGAQEIFRNTVVEYFLDGHRKGQTPNPCLACNKHIRWEFLLEQALDIGADYMATGHYVKLLREKDKAIRLFSAKDKKKDQSYVISVLDQSQLKHALFPLGNLLKSEVIDIARDLKLPAAESKESQDLCFLGGEDYRDFLSRNDSNLAIPGQIQDKDGNTIGHHQGLVNYTIGQRKGIGISSANPVFVLEKKQLDNILVVGSKEELGSKFLGTGEINWVSGKAPTEPFSGQVKIRYSAKKASGQITPIAEGSITVEFNEPVRDITPGQAAVIYDGEEVLGSGLILTTNLENQENNREREKVLA